MKSLKMNEKASRKGKTIKISWRLLSEKSEREAFDKGANNVEEIFIARRTLKCRNFFFPITYLWARAERTQHQHYPMFAPNWRDV